SSCVEHAYPRSVLFVCVAGYRDLSVLRFEYAQKKEKILSRLEDFRRVGTLPDKRLFEEMCFCILAVQSKAHGAEAAVRDLVVRHGVIRPMPPTLTANRYLAIDSRMERFSGYIEIPMAALDLLFWSRETGEIFK